MAGWLTGWTFRKKRKKRKNTEHELRLTIINS